MCERLKYEKEAYDEGYQYIIGLDEAGRGPMAGPLVVGGAIMMLLMILNNFRRKKEKNYMA